jgi:hypothetical protein
MFALFQDFLACTAHDYEDDPNEGDNCDEEDEEDKLSDVGTSWIERWVDQPAGERGRKNTETRPGWGKPDILKTAGITESQYARYMVSFFIILAAELTDPISPRNPCTVCATTTSTSQSPSRATFLPTRPSFASLSQRYGQPTDIP